MAQISNIKLLPEETKKAVIRGACSMCQLCEHGMFVQTDALKSDSSVFVSCFISDIKKPVYDCSNFEADERLSFVKSESS